VRAFDLVSAAAKRAVSMSRHFDTIAALATPHGTSAIAVVRASGPDTIAIARELCGTLPHPRRARHVDYRSREGTLVDDVLVTFFEGPASYSGEHTLEIGCHGNPFIAQTILEDLVSRGCRLAEPGEFTKRAFLNGRMDLSQAEAVMDLIQARSERALAAANQQLRGALRNRIEALVAALLRVLAQIEAYIDFPEEDLPAEDRLKTRRELELVILATNELYATSRYGDLLREGVKTVIIGAPNAGKSSLLNALVGRARSLVSDEPGTTRDFIEETVVIGRSNVRLIDTAGLNPTPGRVEQLGIEQTMERISEADLFLLVVDVSDPNAAPLPSDVIATLPADRTLVVQNKCDLVAPPLLAEPLRRLDRVGISALTGLGIEELRSRIASKIATLATEPPDGVAVNARHAAALIGAREDLSAATAKMDQNEPVELLASDLRSALARFGEITGRIDNERMLDQLFATFCIGK
jgi:tRNA modification GTPase